MYRDYSPDPALVCSLTPVRRDIWCRTNASSAISIANAISVSNAARKDARDASRVKRACVESEKRRAMKAMPPARSRLYQLRVRTRYMRGDSPAGCTASPRVQDGATVTQLDLSALYTVVEYACPGELHVRAPAESYQQ